MGSFTLNGNTLSTSNIVRVTFFLTGGNLRNGGSDHAFKVKYGSTTLASHTLGETGASELSYTGKVVLNLYGNGGTSAQESHSELHASLGPTAIGSGASGISNTYVVATGSATEDSTTNLDIELTVQYSVTAGSNTVTCSAILAELIS